MRDKGINIMDHHLPISIEPN